MFFIEAPTKRHDTSSLDAYIVTVPTYQSQEFRIGARIGIVEQGMAAITLGRVTGVVVSEEPSEDPDDLRGLDGEYVYVEGRLGDRVTVELEGHAGTHDILPFMLIAVGSDPIE